MTKQTLRTAGYWITTVFGPSSFVIGGVLGLRMSHDVVASTTHLGYPVYFILILSIWKILGAAAITAPGLPRVKEWAYAGFFFDLTSAAISRATVGDAVSDVAAPIVFLALVIASWALRPESRRLAAPATTAARGETRRDRSQPGMGVRFAPDLLLGWANHQHRHSNR